MMQMSLSGNLTRDAEIRTTVNGDQVCSFGIAHNKKGPNGEEKVHFVDCSIWGKRGTSLQPHLTKGKKLFVVGEFDTNVKDGTTYLKCRVSELDFGGGGGKQNEDSPTGPKGGDDEIPF